MSELRSLAIQQKLKLNVAKSDMISRGDFRQLEFKLGNTQVMLEQTQRANRTLVRQLNDAKAEAQTARSRWKLSIDAVIAKNQGGNNSGGGLLAAVRAMAASSKLQKVGLSNQLRINHTNTNGSGSMSGSSGGSGSESDSDGRGVDGSGSSNERVMARKKVRVG